MENRFGWKKIGKQFFGNSSQNMVFSENIFQLFFFLIFGTVLRTREQHEQKNTPEPLVLQPSSCESPHRSQLQKKNTSWNGFWVEHREVGLHQNASSNLFGFLENTGKIIYFYFWKHFFFCVLSVFSKHFHSKKDWIWISFSNILFFSSFNSHFLEILTFIAYSLRTLTTSAKMHYSFCFSRHAFISVISWFVIVCFTWVLVFAC